MNAAELNARLPTLLPEIRCYLLRRGCRRADVDDALQDMVIRASAEIHALREPAKLSSWLRVIALNAFRARRNTEQRGYFSRLSLQLPAAGPIPESLFQQIERMLTVFPASPELEPAIIPAALHFILGWTVAEVARAEGCKTSAMAQRLLRFKKRWRFGRYAVVERGRERRAQLYLGFMQHLRSAALQPATGGADTNFLLLRELGALGELLEQWSPEDLRFREERLTTLMWLANVEYHAWRRRGTGTPPPTLIALRRQIDELLADYRRRRAADSRFPWTPRSFNVDFFHGAKMSIIDGGNPDWPVLLRICEQAIRLRPKTNMHWHAAMCIRQIRGPLEAARYLEKYRRVATLRNDPSFYWCLAKNYHLARQWRLAARNYRKLLQWQHNEERHRLILAALEACKQRRLPVAADLPV